MFKPMIARLKALQQETALEMLLQPNLSLDPAYAHGYSIGWVAGVQHALDCISQVLDDEDAKERAA